MFDCDDSYAHITRGEALVTFIQGESLRHSTNFSRRPLQDVDMSDHAVDQIRER